MREAQRARLHRLADSINDTARMARTSLSLVLLVALYLGLTLVASTDENLLLNGQVTLPQAGVGISVAQSYIFAPPIFFYLHIQLLFLLSVLARKVRTFEAALKEEFPDAFLPSLQNKIEAKREECWEWLSAFAFVQLFRRTSEMPHVLKLGAGTLAWFGIEAVPLALLFVIDISFVRYQSAGITWSHHCIFILDLVSIIIFNRLVFLRRNRIWGSASVSVAVPGNAGVLPAFGVDQRPAFLGRICRLMPYRIWWKRLRGLSAIRSNWWILVRSAKVMPAWLWISARGIVAIGMVFLLIYAAHPPRFDPATVESIWRGRGRTVKNDQRSIWWERGKKFWQAVRGDGENLLDAGPCHWWGFGCRYLDVSNKWLLGAQPEDLVAPISDEITPETFRDIRRFHLGSPDLARRKLRFARFESVYLRGVDLREAELQGANLRGAELQGANLDRAGLQGAWLVGAKLQRANLEGAGLQGADLERAELREANLDSADLQRAWLVRADLQGARLERADLQGASLVRADLQGANLNWAELQGANLGGAELQGAWLVGAKLQGANLRWTDLQGANLRGAKLQGANLRRAKLQGANLRGAALQGSEGEPTSWFLTWMPDVSFDFSDSPEQWLQKLLSDGIKDIKVAWREELTLGQYLEERLERYLKGDSKIFDGVEPEDKDLVFHTRKDKKWPSAPDVNSNCYWSAWAKWTADFACENEYTARSSLQRWSSPNWTSMWLMLEHSVTSLGQEIPEWAKETIRGAILKALERPECPGLHALTEDEWKRFVDG